jgi:hypothetical protein
MRRFEKGSKSGLKFLYSDPDLDPDFEKNLYLTRSKPTTMTNMKLWFYVVALLIS